MARVTIYNLAIDRDNREKFHSHGVTARQVLQVLRNRHVVAPNRRNRRANYLLIGFDDGGACLTIPIEPTPDPTIWRPVTAWLSADKEKQVLAGKK